MDRYKVASDLDALGEKLKSVAVLMSIMRYNPLEIMKDKVGPIFQELQEIYGRSYTYDPTKD